MSGHVLLCRTMTPIVGDRCQRNNWKCETCQQVWAASRVDCRGWWKAWGVEAALEWVLLPFVFDREELLVALQIIRVSEKANHAHCPVCLDVVKPSGKSTGRCPWRSSDVSIADGVWGHVLSLPAALDKHTKLTHVPVRCKCGLDVDPGMVDTHNMYECDWRLETCEYCDRQFQYRKLTEHKVGGDGVIP